MHYKNKTRYERRATNDKIVAIDGPAGSGKSTVAKEVAKRLNFLYVDTGAMYRALTLKAIRSKLNLNDKKALNKLAQQVDIRLKMNKDCLKVFLSGKDVSCAIREQTLTEKVHYVARLPGVRKQMLKLQRRLAQQAGGAVLEGRDIGTVVFPNAQYKFYLDAQFKERVKRRYKELGQSNQRVNAEEVAADIKKRDKSDITRVVAPLVKAKDAVYIDSTNSTINEVVEKIMKKCST